VSRRLQDRYFRILLDKLEATRYPSPPVLNRVEAAVPDRAAAESYIDSLLDHIEQDSYPSPSMLDRVNRLMGLL
jgi:hypothetical protein